MYSTLVITPDSVEYAMEKLNNFVTVNQQHDMSNKLDALETYCESLGVDDDILTAMFERLYMRFTNKADAVFVGILIGLTIADHGVENYGPRS